MQRKLNNYQKLIIVALLYIVLFIFFSLTSPDNLPIAVLFVPFIWLFVCIFLTLLWTGERLFKNHQTSNVKRFEFALLGAAIPPLLLLLKSIDQLTAKDAVLLLGVYFLTIFYISKVNFSKHK